MHYIWNVRVTDRGNNSTEVLLSTCYNQALKLQELIKHRNVFLKSLKPTGD